MKSFYHTLVALFLLLNGSALVAQTVSPDYLDGHLYIKVEDTSSVVLDPLPNDPALNALLNANGADSLYLAFRTPEPILEKIYRLEFSNLSGTASLIASLNGFSFIEYAEQVPLVQTTSVVYLPNDFQTNQYGLVKINAESAWDISQGSSSVVVAIVDNAIFTGHEDLSPALWVNPGEGPNNFIDDDLNGYIDDVNGYDVADLDGNPNPPVGTTMASPWNHGTHCAGTAGAATDNGVGIASIGFGVSLMAVKASLNSTGGNTLERAYEGVDYAMSAGADVISMSWGSPGNSVTGNTILSLAQDRGIVLIAAAGNDNDSMPFYPAAFAEVLSVGATNAVDARSSFSNYGSYIDVMAPGTDIYSTMASGTSAYGNLSGTSMACPLVAGLAGLLRSANSTLGPVAIKNAIVNGCENIDLINPGFAGKLGAGRINALNSMNLALVEREEAEPIAAFTLYPIPARDRLFLANLESGQSVSLELYDLAGKLQRRSSRRELENGMDVSNLERGVYLARVRLGSTQLTQKILLQ